MNSRNLIIGTLLTAILLLVAAPVAIAQDEGGGGPEVEKFDFKKAMKEIDELMRQAEESLIESVRSGRKAAEGDAAAKKIDELLKSHGEKGDSIVKMINKIIKNAPRGGGGGGGSGQPPPDGKSDPKNGGKRDDRSVKDRDPRNSSNRNPKDGDESKAESEKEKGANPPDGAKEKPKAIDPSQWIAQLPPRLRDKVRSGNFEDVPEKYRPIIEAYFKKLAEIEK